MLEEILSSPVLRGRWRAAPEGASTRSRAQQPSTLSDIAAQCPAAHRPCCARPTHGSIKAAGRPLVLQGTIPGGRAGRGMAKGSGIGRIEAPSADGSAFQKGLTRSGAGPLRQPARLPEQAPGRASAGHVLAVPARGARPGRRPAAPAGGAGPKGMVVSQDVVAEKAGAVSTNL